jgi:glycosyltransferase involved in cell wall biosynthesis
MPSTPEEFCMSSVSVVVPTYEREQLLTEALDSALAQTYDDFVILVGDNSETDGTEKLIASYHDPRIRYHRNRPGLGALGNWLDLVQRAETPLIATLHDDDLWEPDYLATVVPPMLEDPGLAMTFNDFWVIDEHGQVQNAYTEEESARTHRNRIPGGRFDYDLEEGLQLVAVWNAPQPCYAATIRRDAILAIDFPEQMYPLYDIWTSYHLVKRGQGLRYEPRRLTRYRVHSSAGTNDARFNEAEDWIFRHIIAENRSLPVAEEINHYWSEIRWYRGTRLMGDGPAARSRSQQELTAAAAGLQGPKRLAAQAAGRSGLVWDSMRLAWNWRHRAPHATDIRHQPLLAT